MNHMKVQISQRKSLKKETPQVMTDGPPQMVQMWGISNLLYMTRHLLNPKSIPAHLARHRVQTMISPSDLDVSQRQAYKNLIAEKEVLGKGVSNALRLNLFSC